MRWRIDRHRNRQAMIDACRLIGYTIEPAHDKWGPYKGERYRYVLMKGEYPIRFPGGWLETGGKSGYTITFRFMWEAAEHALKLEGLDVSAYGSVRKGGEKSCIA